ncbi:MAG: tetratricopeptide repeat protein [Fidelibacterota bacterium]
MKRILITVILFLFVYHAGNANDNSGRNVDDLIVKANTLLDASERDSLNYYLARIVNTARNSATAKIYRDAVYDVGNIYKKIGMLDSARHYLEIAMDMNFEMNDSVGIGMVKNQLGDIARYQSRPLEARQLFIEATKILKNQDNKQELGKAVNNLGALYVVWGEYNSANHLFLKALENYMEAGYQEGVAWLQFSMSQLFKRIGEYEQALVYSKKSLQIYEQLAARNGDSAGVRICYAQLGFLYTHHFDSLEKALKYQMQVLRMARKTGINAVLADGYNGVGQVYYKMEKYENAKKYINKALELRYEANIKNGIPSNLKFLGYIEKDLGNYEKAKEYFTKAIQSAIIHKDKSIRNDVYYAFSSLYQDLNDYDKALIYMKKHLALKDSILSTEIAKRVASTQLQFEVEQKDQENKFLLQQNKIQQLRIQRSRLLRNFLYAAVGIIVIISLFAIYLVLKQRQIKRLYGLVPICTSCKKIRNDSGYYEQLEEYVAENSEASFSHGICPDCMEELYPDLYEKMKNKYKQQV